MGDEQPKPYDLAKRTKQFALRVIRLYERLPKRVVAQVIGKQVLRSGTSVGAQYRESQRARSTAEFLSKVESSIQELEETRYWLDLLVESEIVKTDLMAPLQQEAKELTAILTQSVKTAKKRPRK